MSKTTVELAAEILIAMIAKGTLAELQEEDAQHRAAQLRIIHKAVVDAYQDKS